MINKISEKSIEFSLSEVKRYQGHVKDFGSFIRDAINKVDNLGKEADMEITKFLTGEGTDLHNIMIALEKSNISFRLITEIRNKVINAYEEIMRMQV